jgi:hypothetical protein
MTAENINSLIIGIFGSIIATVFLWICKPLLKKFGKFLFDEISKRNAKYRKRIYRNAAMKFNDATIHLIGCICFIIAGSIKAECKRLSIKLLIANPIITQKINSNLDNAIDFFFVSFFIILGIICLFNFLQNYKSNGLLQIFEFKMRLFKINNDERIELEYQWTKMSTKEDYDKIMKQIENIAELRKDKLK